MSRVIKSLPDDFDPITIIKRKMRTCPICGQYCDDPQDRWTRYHIYSKYLDIFGKYHKFRKSLNKYRWDRIENLKCQNCGCEWDTGWYPADHSMFEIAINEDDNSNYEVVRA